MKTREPNDMLAWDILHARAIASRAVHAGHAPDTARRCCLRCDAPVLLDEVCREECDGGTDPSMRRIRAAVLKRQRRGQVSFYAQRVLIPMKKRGEL